MDKNVVKSIFEDIDSMSFESILSRYAITQGELLGILESFSLQELSKKKSKQIQNLLLQKSVLMNIKGKRFGLIADTHIGNKKANWDYIQAAHDFFYYNGADAILHLGDLFDGYHDDYTGKRAGKILHYLEKQLQEFEERYPNQIPTYLLLGNHDEWFRQYNIDLFQEIPLRNPTMTVLDYGGYQVNLNGKPFYLSHPISNVYYVSNQGCIMTIRGHSHYFEYNQQQKIFRLNTCSDTHPNPAGGDYELTGGFSMLSFPKKTICFENYSFYHGDIVKSLCLKI